MAEVDPNQRRYVRGDVVDFEPGVRGGGAGRVRGIYFGGDHARANLQGGGARGETREEREARLPHPRTQGRVSALGSAFGLGPAIVPTSSPSRLSSRRPRTSGSHRSDRPRTSGGARVVDAQHPDEDEYDPRPPHLTIPARLLLITRTDIPLREALTSSMLVTRVSEIIPLSHLAVGFTPTFIPHTCYEA